MNDRDKWIMIKKDMNVIRSEVLSWYLLCGAQERHKIPQPPYPVSSTRISVCVRQHATTFTIDSWSTACVQHRSFESNQQQNSSHMDSALWSGSPWNTAVYFKGCRQVVRWAQYGETFETVSTLYPFCVSCSMRASLSACRYRVCMSVCLLLI